MRPYLPHPQTEVFDVEVIGGKNCPKVSTIPDHKSTFNVGSIQVTALHTPCHTQDSICFFFEDGDDRAVFTGDTLFIGGCGRFFEGTPAEMHKALNDTLASLPDDTKVYPGHEYTKGNVKFAKTVLSNDALTKLDEYSQQNIETQGKFTIGDEKVRDIPFQINISREINVTLTAALSNTTSSCASQTQPSKKPQVKQTPSPSWASCAR